MVLRQGVLGAGSGFCWHVVALVLAVAAGSLSLAVEAKEAGRAAASGEGVIGGSKSAGKQQKSSAVPGEELPWRDIKQQRCNIGMQSAYQKPMFKTNHVSATCGVYNEDIDVDFSSRPCCCSYCGQRDPFEQLCEIVKHVCTTVSDCIQRHHGECKEDSKATGDIDGFHIFWILAVGSFTVAPFIVPVFALRAADDIVQGLAG